MIIMMVNFSKDFAVTNFLIWLVEFGTVFQAPMYFISSLVSLVKYYQANLTTTPTARSESSARKQNAELKYSLIICVSFREEDAEVR